MNEAWIQLQCPECETTWEENPAEMPEPDAEYACDSCGTTRSAGEFARSTRDFEILADFHA
jgi:uncharacterized Zn ribbon protein